MRISAAFLSWLADFFKRLSGAYHPISGHWRLVFPSYFCFIFCIYSTDTNCLFFLSFPRNTCSIQKCWFPTVPLPTIEAALFAAKSATKQRNASGDEVEQTATKTGATPTIGSSSSSSQTTGLDSSSNGHRHIGSKNSKFRIQGPCSCSSISIKNELRINNNRTGTDRLSSDLLMRCTTGTDNSSSRLSMSTIGLAKPTAT